MSYTLHIVHKPDTEMPFYTAYLRSARDETRPVIIQFTNIVAEPEILMAFIEKNSILSGEA